MNRKGYIGASDLAAILGVSKYANAHDVYMQKVYELDDVDKPVMKRGRFLESGVLDWFESEHEVELTRDVRVRFPGDELFIAQCDGLTPDGEPVEAKTSATDTEWGAPYTSEIPDEYIVQAQVQMLCTGAARCHVPAVVCGYNSMELREYTVLRDDEIIAALRTAGRKFWDEHVIPRVPPVDAPTMETVKRIRREPASMVELTEVAANAVAAYEAARDAAKLADAAKEEAQAALLALLGDAECGTLPDSRQVRYMSQNGPMRVDTKRLAAQWPEVAAEVCSKSSFRVMRIK